MQMEIYMKESGKMIKLMAMELLWIQIMLDIKAFGWMTYNMGKEKKSGTMGQPSI